MKTIVYVSAILAFVAGASITFAIIHWLGKGSPELALGVGAILGTQIAAMVHHRIPDASSSSRVKASIGAALALSTIALSTVLHTTWGVFDYPEISIPIAIVGTFGFPFVLFDTMWGALSK